MKPKEGIFSLISKDLKYRLQGDLGRANARWGMVSPPPGQAKLIWLRAGASRDSVTLAAGLLAAIRQKRLDVRLVLTYEEEYRDIIVTYLSGLEKIGFGFNCADRDDTESRMLKRLNPFAVIFCDKPGQGIIHALAHLPVPHVVNFQTAAVNGLTAEINVANYRHATTEKPIEAMTLLMQAQVDKQLGALLNGGQSRPIFLLNGCTEATLSNVVSQWKESALYNTGILCISPLHYNSSIVAALQKTIGNLGMKTVVFSKWDRKKAANNEIFIIDEWRWFAAIAASALAIHLIQTDTEQFWQSMASATAVSLSDKQQAAVNIDLPLVPAQDLISYWQGLNTDTFQCRQLGDANRRLFWQYRREAQQGIEQLLQRIFDW